MKIVVNCVSELEAVATSIIDLINEKNIVCFYGEMGVGKTTFIKEICKKLRIKDLVSSPTFSIINEYISEDNDLVYHFDFYRIEDEEEAFDLGYEEYFYQGNLCLIEWPEKIPSIIPANIVKVQITKIGEQRIIEISNL